MIGPDEDGAALGHPPEAGAWPGLVPRASCRSMRSEAPPPVTGSGKLGHRSEDDLIVFIIIDAPHSCQALARAISSHSSVAASTRRLPNFGDWVN